jgi:hypothetical protein
MIYFLGSGIDIANDQCIAAFEEVFGPEVTIFGATSSDTMKGFISYQAADDAVYEHGAYAIGFCDPTLTIDTQATHGFIAIGEPMEVTQSNGHVIQEINGKPAWSEYLNKLLGGIIPPEWCHTPFEGGYMNLPALFILHNIF